MTNKGKVKKKGTASLREVVKETIFATHKAVPTLLFRPYFLQ